MKKLLLIICCLALISPAKADVLKAKAVDTISTTSPKEIISVRLVKDFNLDSETKLKEGYVLTGKMLDVVSPDKWHHNASFTFIPTSYTDNAGNKYEITKEIKAEYKQKIRPIHTEWGVGLPNGTYFSPQYVSDITRMAKGESKQVVDEYVDRTTPWGKGIQIEIKPNELIYFNFPE